MSEIGWQPIETAPHDEDAVVLLFGDGPGFEDCPCAGRWFAGGWFSFPGFEPLTPHLWMPIPEVTP